MRTKRYSLEFNVGSLRPGHFLQRRRSNDDSAVTVPAGLMQQRCGGLNEALPHARLVFLNNRTPDCFQRFMSEPKLAAVKQLPGVREVSVSFYGGHRFSVISHQTDNR